MLSCPHYLKKIPLFGIAVRSFLYLLVAAIAVLIAADVAFVTRQSVIEVLFSADIRAAIWLTIWTSAVTTLICLVVAVPAGYALSRLQRRGNMVLDTLVDLLIVLPVLVVGVSLLVLFRAGTELASLQWPVVRQTGIAISALGDYFIYKKAGIVLAQFICSIPFAIRVIKSTFDNLDRKIEQVALTLGCTRGGAFRRVALPMARQGIIAGAVLAWARAFGLFGPISIIAGAVRRRTEVLSTSIFLEISVGQLETAIAISILMVIIASIVLLTMRAFTGGNIFGGGVRS